MEILKELKEKIEVEKEIISLMPKNNKKNREKLLDKLNENINLANEKIDTILDEIKLRNKKFNESKDLASDNDRIYENIKEVEDLNYVLNIINKYNLPYEKIGLDFALHKFNYYYRNDLNLINEVIIKLILDFKNIDINLDLKDFIYSKYATEYLENIFNEIEKNELKSVLEEDKLKKINTNLKESFEKIYWKCPDLITHIKICFRGIYNKYEKKINSFYDKSKNEILNNALPKMLYVKYKNLLKEKDNLIKNNKKLIIEDFLNEKNQIKKFDNKNIYKEYEKYIPEIYLKPAFENNIFEINKNLINLKNAVYEYKMYTNIKYILEDIINKYNEVKDKKVRKETEKELKKTFKDILNKEKKLIKISNIEKGFLARNLKDKEKVDQNNLILELDSLYDKYDELYLKKKIYTMLNDSSSLNDILKFISSHPRETFRIIKKKFYEDTEEDNLNKTKSVIEFSIWPYKNLINNININEDKNLKHIIKDKYRLLNIKLTEEMLAEDNLENLISDLELIEEYDNIKRNNISLDILKNNIEFIKIIKNEEKNERK